jgi:dienelactone hydrolase
VAFHYRGYAPSEGWPSAKSLMQDAVALHDLLVEKLHPAQIVALGISIGSGPAAYLSRHRRIAGAVLITPFDSLTKLAGDLYWWAPVRLLLRHRIEVASLISTIEEPVAIIAAAEDRIVPPTRTNALRKSVGYLIFDRTISGAGHNNIYDHPQFASTLDEAVTRIESRPRDRRSKTQ